MAQTNNRKDVSLLESLLKRNATLKKGFWLNIYYLQMNLIFIIIKFLPVEPLTLLLFLRLKQTLS